MQEFAIKVFKKFDVDNSNTIEREETIKFWSKNFGKLNTREMFKDLDQNNDNQIEMSEWMEFWGRVKKSGYDEEEIKTELQNIYEGNSWAHFSLENAK